MLGASVLRSMFAGKAVIRANKETNRADEDF